MSAYIFDIIIVLILIFFAWRGAKKGLILSLLGLFGLVIALFGAKFISSSAYQPVANIIQPKIYQSIIKTENDLLGEDIRSQISIPLDVIQQAINKVDGFPGLKKIINSGVENNSLQQREGHSAEETLARYLAEKAAKLALFVIAFLLILLLWFLLSHALNLAFKLPILKTFNTAGGLLLGLIKASAIVLILVWVLQMAGVVSENPTTPVLSLFTVQNLSATLTRILL